MFSDTVQDGGGRPFTGKSKGPGVGVRGLLVEGPRGSARPGRSRGCGWRAAGLREPRPPGSPREAPSGGGAGKVSCRHLSVSPRHAHALVPRSVSSGGHSDVPLLGEDGDLAGRAEWGGPGGQNEGPTCCCVRIAQAPEGRGTSSRAPPALLRALPLRFPSSAPPSNPGLKLLFSPYGLVQSCLSSGRFPASSPERRSRPRAAAPTGPAAPRLRRRPSVLCPQRCPPTSVAPRLLPCAAGRAGDAT